MQQPIIDFTLDDEGHWVALLDCGHRQRVRHRPPFFPRPWVLTEKGRNGKLGVLLDCVRCERDEAPELPSGRPQGPHALDKKQS